MWRSTRWCPSRLREFWREETGGVREVLRQHLPYLLPFIYRAFVSLTGGGEVVGAGAAFMQGGPCRELFSFSGADKRTKRDIHLTRALPYMEGT